MTASLSAVKRTLDQVRALNAYTAGQADVFAGKEGGEVAKKIPSLVVMHGLLGAMAFALSDENKKGHQAVFEAILEHLQDPVINDMTAQGVGKGAIDEWFKKLSETDAAQLRLTTAEVLAYLTFLRRFAKKKKEGCDGK